MGYAVETASKNGFSGMIRMVVGFDATGRVLNVNVLEQNETPGLGTKMADEGNPLFASFEGRNPGEMKLAVKKDRRSMEEFITPEYFGDDDFDFEFDFEEKE